MDNVNEVLESIEAKADAYDLKIGRRNQVWPKKENLDNKWRWGDESSENLKEVLDSISKKADEYDKELGYPNQIWLTNALRDKKGLEIYENQR